MVLFCSYLYFAIPTFVHFGIKYLLCAIYVFKIILSVSMSMQVPWNSYGIQKTVLSVCSHLSACLRQSLMLFDPVYSRHQGSPCLCLSACLQNAGTMDTCYHIPVYWVLWILTHVPLANKLFLGFIPVYRFTGKKCLGFLKRINYSDIGGSYKRN